MSTMSNTHLLSLTSALSLAFIIITKPTIAQLSGHIGCFVDLSNQADRKTDIVLYANASVKAFTQSHHDAHSTKARFRGYAQFDVGTDDKVVSVSAMDWNRNGVADLFVVTQRDPTDDASPYQLNVWQDNHSTFVKVNNNALDLNDQYVLIMDANGDFIPDIFGKSQTGDIGFWFGNSEGKFGTFVSLNLANQTIEMQSVSFIDMDQDCKPDLVFITKNHNDSTRYVKMISGTDFDTPRLLVPQKLLTMLPHWQNRLFFADINNDGITDLIIPNTQDNKVHIFVQDTSNALNFKELCRRRATVTFEPNSGCTVTLNAPSGYMLKDNLPFIVADINMDRQTNLVALLDNDVHQKVFVTTLSQKNINDFDGKTLEHDTTIGNLFNQYTADGNSIADMAFFHSGEFPLGLHFLIEGKDHSFDFIDLEPILNDKNYGFLSVCPLNGVDPTEKKYGGAMPGVMVKAFFRSSNGHSIFLSAGTLYQSNSGNHLLPFIVFGLAEPESYIEKLVIGYGLHGEHRIHYFQQPGVPPNSQLVLFASNSWRLETFLAPYMTAPMLAVIITLVMSILGGMWVYLEIQEKKSMTDDKLKGASTTHNFFF
eukprot:1016328_1